MTDWSSLRINVARLRQQNNLTELKRRTERDASIPIDASVVADDLAITTARIPDGSIVEVSGVADTTLSGIEVRAHVSSSWEGECRRCLDLVTAPIELDLVVPFIPGADGSDDSDAYPLDEDVIDVGEVVREELMLALPLSPLCSDDCVGADPDRFLSASDDEDSSGEDDEDEAGDVTIDPRWAALSELSFDEE